MCIYQKIQAFYFHLYSFKSYKSKHFKTMDVS